MTLDPCRACRSPTRPAFCAQLLGKPVRYEACTECGYLQTQAPDWLHKAYASAIDSMDTGILSRNQLNVQRVIATLMALRRLRGRVVDHAGGYGVLVRLLRDAGVDAYWQDKYCDNLFARGFEADDHPCDLITAFEVFEHFEHPTQELRAMLRRAPHVLLSTELIPGTADPDPSWWYLGGEHGQHIGFFRRSSLERMAQDAGCHLGTDGKRLHLFSRQPIPATWRALVAAPTLTRLAQRVWLRSKTMSDFEQMRSTADAADSRRSA
jgi:Methyltransferase domain